MKIFKLKIFKKISSSRIIENNKCGRRKEKYIKNIEKSMRENLFHGQFRKAMEQVRGKKS